jgi:hypothetical protein
MGGQGGVGKAYTIADGTTPVYYALVVVVVQQTVQMFFQVV